MRGAGSGERSVPVRSEHRCHGFTFVEVLVVLALLGLVMGISGLALVGVNTTREFETVRAFRTARAQAIRTGRPVHTVSDRSPLPAPVLFLPDGSARGPGVDFLTGRPHAAP